MASLPSQDVIDAMEAGITQTTRRLEIYEQDGVTPWYPNGSEEDTFRLIDGSISIDSSRDERRSFDMSLDNVDNKLRPSPDDGFWYDKILRPYRGIKFASKTSTPKVLIIESATDNTARALKAVLAKVGFTNVDINRNATTLAHCAGYKILVSDAGAGATTKAALLADAFTSGFSIFTCGLGNGVGEIPWATAETAFTAAAPLFVTPVSTNTPLAGGWTSEAQGSVAGMAITAVDSTATVVATSLNNAVTHFTSSLKETSNARWFDYKPNAIGTQATILIGKAMVWLWNYQANQEWETPLGEFLIDRITTQNFPNTISISGRDRTKICLGSKIEKSESFEAGTSTNQLITALAANAGITKIKLSAQFDAALGTRIDASAGTERWNIMNQAAASLGQYIYFDREGYLVTSPYADPTLGSPIAIFQTGSKGNLVSFSRATSDDRIYNHIIVTSDSSDVDSLGFFGEAINNNPNSPTSVSRLGDRSYFYSSPFFTSDDQCKAYAIKLLGQTAFEQYEVNFSSITYPWIDTGIVIDLLDPDNISSDPTRFLMDTLTIPLSLGAMDATAKRVLFIQGADDVEAA